MDDWLIIRFLLFFGLLLFSAFFSGAEVALFSLSRVEIDLMSEKRGSMGKAVAALLAKPRRLLVTIYIGNEIINVSIAAVATVIALQLFDEYAIAISIGVGTFMLLIFGEITPKTFAIKHAQGYAVAAALPLTAFSKIIYPVQSAVTWMANTAIKAAGGTPVSESSQITEDELKTLLNHGEDKGVIEPDEKEMIINVFELGDTTVTEIMTPRTEIFALPMNEGIEGISRRAVLSNYSRIPVYGKDVDHIEGILYVKDLLAPGLEKRTEDVKDLLHDAYLIPSTKKIDALLREFRKKKIHMAIILDEYGGVEGLCTLEDILEEVVGEPADMKKHDEIIKLETGEYQIHGRLGIEEFNADFKTSLEHEEVDTMGGFVFHLFGRMPRWGEAVCHSGITFTVQKLKGKAISQLTVKMEKTTPEEKKAKEAGE